MPDLYIYEQCKRNLSKILSCITDTLSSAWACLDKYGTGFSNAFNHEIVGRITRKAHKYSKCLKILAVVVAVMMLISALFLASFKSAGAREQGIEINYT